MQRPPPQLLEIPSLADLYAIELSEEDAWHQLGLELGLDRGTLDSIKTENVKQVPRKRAMFRKWKDRCAQGTWEMVVAALEKVDRSAAQYVYRNLALDVTESEALRPHTMHFPLEIERISLKSNVSVDHKQAISGAPDSSPVQEEAADSLLPIVGGSLGPRETSTFKSESMSASVECHDESEHAMRSFSADAYETAGEDEPLMAFNSQHGGVSAEEEAGKLAAATKTEGDQAIVTAFKTDSVTTIKLLVESKKLTAKTRLKHERTALMCAALHGSKLIIAYLLKIEGLNSLTELDEDGAMPLYFAVSEGFYEAAKLLVTQHKAKKVTIDLYVKGTPIMISPASKGFSMICELLLENGADPNLQDTNGETALHAAALNGHKDVVKVLLKFGANISIVSKKTSMTPLECSIESRSKETTVVLVEATMLMKQKNLKLFTCETREKVRKLVKEGAWVDFRRGDETTPLMCYSESGNLDLVLELLGCNANVDLQDKEGESALMKASCHGHVNIVEVLIKHEAILDLKTIKGQTALALSILHGHPTIVSRLMLAGANTKIKDKNGHPLEKLAMHTGNQEIIDILERSRSVVRQEPFIDVLSGYFDKKVQEESAKKDAKERRKMVAKEELLGKVPKPPDSAKSEEQALREELKKSYERISSLEIRVHDLTLQITSEPPPEDITFLERNRLEAEFLKLKEVKRKAEKYAVEAKQTSLRLSAENAKLREDLAKERKYNQLTRDSIMHDLEKVAEETVEREKKTQAKLKVFEEEVAARAQQLALSTRTSLVAVGKLDFSPLQLKEIILQHSLRMSLSLLVVGGLPCSGKTTLLRSMLQLKERSPQDVCKLPESGLTVMEAAMMKNPFCKGRLQWFSAIAKDDAEVLMLAVCLAQVCAKTNQSLSTEESKECVVEVFQSSRLNEYVGKTFNRLVNLITRLEKEGMNLQCLQHASLAFMNVWDVGVNRAVCNAMLLLARRCKNLVLVNVVDLKSDAENFDKPLDLQNQSRYGGRYSVRKDDKNSMQIYTAGEYYTRFVKFSNQLANSSLLVGTHKDAFGSEEKKQRMLKLNALVRHSVQEKFSGTRFHEALYPHMLSVDARSEEDADKVRATVEEMIWQGERMEASIPLTWIMLRGILHMAKHLFVTQSELWSYASECGLQSQEELEAWLGLFQSCLSIIYCSDDSIPSLHTNVIINPFKFIECLDCVYYAELNDDLLADESLKEHLDLLPQGLLTYTLAERIWADKLDNTESYKNMLCNFMLRVLKDLSICTKVEIEVKPSPPANEVYFIPSLRPYLKHKFLSTQSDPLMVHVPHVHQVPFDMCVEFLASLEQQTMEHLTFVSDNRYNVLHLSYKKKNDELEADITFHVLNHADMVEVNVTVEGQGTESDALRKEVCSIMKTACVGFFHEISRRSVDMTYKFGVVSPTCLKETAGLVHFVAFDVSGDQDLENLACCCGKKVSLAECSDQSRLWMKCAYQGSPLMVIPEKDILSRHDLLNVANDLYSFSLDKISNLATILGISQADFLTLKQFCTPEDFPLLILLEWKKRHAIASRPKLAKALLACDLQSLATKLDPNIETTSPAVLSYQPTTASLSTKELSILSQISPASKWEKLGLELGFQAEEIEPLLQIKDKPPDTDILKTVLKNWEEKHHSKGEMLQTLVEALTRIGLRGIASSLVSLQQSESDSGLLK